MPVLGGQRICARLQESVRGKVPLAERGDEVISLTGQQINWLLDGYDISAMKGHKKLY